MRKLPSEFENIIDDKIINLADNTSSFFYDSGFDPNSITTISSISCILCIIFLFQSKFYLGAFFLLVSYFFDCLDGHLARKYNMVTVFGDYYDHISDILKIFFVLLSLYIINKTKFLIVIPFILGLFILMILHIGCQEIYYNNRESNNDSNNNSNNDSNHDHNSLKFSKNFCPVYTNDKYSLETALSFTNYFGCGTVYIALICSILYYEI